MPSLWPWGRQDVSSPASFEKTLRRLASQISAQATTLDARRTQARRLRALWTLYAALFYFIFLALALLVVGYRAWGATEWAGVGAAPVGIYAVRRAVGEVTDWRVRGAERRLKELQRERDATIAKLKEATRYDSTKELLDKYGGSQGRKKKENGEDGDAGTKHRKTAQHHQPPPQRTGFAPPPTANIASRQAGPGSGPGTSAPPPRSPPSLPSPPPRGPPAPHDALAPAASFAPNAFPVSPPLSPSSPSALPPGGSSTWYDRLLDALLGDDESAARNRLALLCAACGLVNGLAPPGARSLADVGRWRCRECGAVNGERAAGNDGTRGPRANRRATMGESAVEKAVLEITGATGLSAEEVRKKLGEEIVPKEEGKDGGGEESDVTVYSDEEGTSAKGAEEVAEGAEAEAEEADPEGAEAEAEAEAEEAEAGPEKAATATAAETTGRDVPARSTRSRKARGAGTGAAS